MENAILEKILETLNGPLDQEAFVSYLLAEIRKYLEVKNDHRFPKLRLFCNWALHPALDGPAAQRIVAEADAYLQKSFQMGCTPTETAAFERMLNLDDFRTELRAFLQATHLPTSVCDDARWKSFLGLYARIVEDCPLTLTGSSGPNAMIDQMVVSFVEDSAAGGAGPQAPHFFPMDWEFLKAGTKRGTLRLRPRGELPGATLDWK